MSARTAWFACVSPLALARYLPNSFCFSTARPIAAGRLISTDRLTDNARRRLSSRLSVSNYPARGFDPQQQFGASARDIHGVGADAAGKAALRAQCELLQRRMFRSFVDTALE